MMTFWNVPSPVILSPSPGWMSMKLAVVPLNTVAPGTSVASLSEPVVLVNLEASASSDMYIRFCCPSTPEAMW